MPQSVSVPEKTLEHWSSQYVMYRYQAKAALWWPTSREDIDVRLSTRPETYPGFPHGMPTTHADTINNDLLAFIQS
jgi:hypothetical protein